MKIKLLLVSILIISSFSAIADHRGHYESVYNRIEITGSDLDIWVGIRIKDGGRPRLSIRSRYVRQYFPNTREYNSYDRYLHSRRIPHSHSKYNHFLKRRVYANH